MVLSISFQEKCPSTFGKMLKAPSVSSLCIGFVKVIEIAELTFTPVAPFSGNVLSTIGGVVVSTLRVSIFTSSIRVAEGEKAEMLT